MYTLYSSKGIQPVSFFCKFSAPLLSVCFAVNCRRLPHPSFKQFGENKGIRIPTRLRYTFYRKLCDGQKLRRSRNPEVNQILLWRLSQFFCKKRMQIPSCNPRIIRHIRHLYPIVIIVLDKLQRFLDIDIIRMPVLWHSLCFDPA